MQNYTADYYFFDLLLCLINLCLFFSWRPVNIFFLSWYGFKDFLKINYLTKIVENIVLLISLLGVSFFAFNFLSDSLDQQSEISQVETTVTPKTTEVKETPVKNDNKKVEVTTAENKNTEN